MTLVGKIQDGEIVLPLTIRIGTDWQVVRAVVDTGFTATLAIPAKLVAQVEGRNPTTVILGDGSSAIYDSILVGVDWMQGTKNVVALVGGQDVLIGMELLHRCRLTADIVSEGPAAVTIIP